MQLHDPRVAPSIYRCYRYCSPIFEVTLLKLAFLNLYLITSPRFIRFIWRDKPVLEIHAIGKNWVTDRRAIMQLQDLDLRGKYDFVQLNDRRVASPIYRYPVIFFHGKKCWAIREGYLELVWRDKPILELIDPTKNYAASRSSWLRGIQKKLEILLSLIVLLIWLLMWVPRWSTLHDAVRFVMFLFVDD